MRRLLHRLLRRHRYRYTYLGVSGRFAAWICDCGARQGQLFDHWAFLWNGASWETPVPSTGDGFPGLGLSTGTPTNRLPRPFRPGDHRQWKRWL